MRSPHESVSSADCSLAKMEEESRYHPSYPEGEEEEEVAYFMFHRTRRIQCVFTPSHTHHDARGDPCHAKIRLHTREVRGLTRQHVEGCSTRGSFLDRVKKIASSLFETLFKDFSDFVRYQNSFFFFSLKDDESGNLKLKRLFFFFSYNLNCNYVY